jgi:hypothetical protein
MKQVDDPTPVGSEDFRRSKRAVRAKIYGTKQEPMNGHDAARRGH